jgi:predicted O-methyltransferase YrrM
MNKPLPMKSKITSEKVARYVVEQINPDSEIEYKLRLETLKLEAGGMISGSDVGALLGILAQSVLAKKAIEVGTFTGYTALKIASALPQNGLLVCCDISDVCTSIGKTYWNQAAVSDKIDLRIAPAIETLNSLILNQEENTFDFAFIDADKAGYDSYYEACLKLIRPGGLIVLDNMLWSGAVADSEIQDSTTIALRQLNLKISQDQRVNSCLMTVGDGLMLARKK